MIPFPFNGNRFSFFFFFFVADHLLVGKFCTNPKSDRSLLLCLKVTQCSTSEIGDAPLYKSCSLPIQVTTARTIAGLPRRTQGDENVSGYGYGIWCGFMWGPNHATSHLRSRLERQHQSVPGCAEECGNPLVQPGGRWQTLGVAAGLGAGPQVQRDPGLASEGVLRLRTLLSLAPNLPDLNPLDCFVWSYVENITKMTSHNTKASLIAAIRRVFAEIPPALVKKACSQFRIRIEAVSEAEGVYIESMSSLLHNQVSWIDFFNKIFKIKLQCCFLLDDNFIIPPCRCQLYYIIKLSELIFSIKVLK